MKLSSSELERIEADLALILKPIWNLDKEDQKMFLEKLINKIAGRANVIHEPIQFVERVYENEIPTLAE